MRSKLSAAQHVRRCGCVCVPKPHLCCLEALPHVQVGGGLVNHVDIRLLRRHHRDGKPLQLATRQVLDVAVEHLQTGGASEGIGGVGGKGGGGARAGIGGHLGGGGGGRGESARAQEAKALQPRPRIPGP